MKNKLILIPLFMSLCSAAQKSPGTYEQDTVPERTNPGNLNLRKHQVFIDTTRTSIFYQAMKNWKPSESATDEVTRYVKELKGDFRLSRVNLHGFPREWITLQKLNGVFLLYERCDGMDQRFVITDSTFNIYGVLESEADIIDRVITCTQKEIKFDVHTIRGKTGLQKASVSIYPTSTTYVYILDYLGQKRFVTQFSNIGKFDLLVNHCPEMKETEYHGFDK